ncbi:DNA gyrase inhibitor YacG [Antarcticirhabdus aurantiaca]|uniref:DNA gyrase inhibitor YacG n=1 Tax=Antarcticirhabdus aurantiaca TaxID=2606717 RepID=A0ACD4NK73_9HYPH|nr:DNA gyrase inhibitor YacG [Antarcticirhabdus aurantiaca]WAJ27223.1 DNA gyrase inhibitor YacG [Jeongeuplla avenae]
MPKDAIVTPLRPKRQCPECGRPSERAVYPFCSVRCKDVDLHRWLTGSYVIPGEDAESPPSDDGR